jgi:hypothetical protein
MNIQPGSGSGLSGQAKPDWSSSSSAKPDGPTPAQVDQSAQSGVASEVQKQTPVQESDKSSLVSKIKSPETWSATLADLKAALAKLGAHRSDETTQELALLMMQHGIEISEDNLSQLEKALKGRTSKASLNQR